MRLRSLFLLGLAAASPVFALTTLTTLPAGCGITAPVRCVNIPITSAGSGYVWLNLLGSTSHFIDFTTAGPNKLTSVTYNPIWTWTTIVPYNNSTHSPDNSYKLVISSFSGVDQNGLPYSGYGEFNFHYVYTTGSGRGGGGAGWHLIEDSGTVTLY